MCPMESGTSDLSSRVQAELAPTYTSPGLLPAGVTAANAIVVAPRSTVAPEPMCPVELTQVVPPFVVTANVPPASASPYRLAMVCDAKTLLIVANVPIRVHLRVAPALYTPSVEIVSTAWPVGSVCTTEKRVWNGNASLASTSVGSLSCQVVPELQALVVPVPGVQ